MQELTANVSWLAVIVGAALAFLLGWLWYSPMLFGKRWAEGVGVAPGSASTMPMAAMITQAVALLLLAWMSAVVLGGGAVALFILIFVAFALMNYAGGLFAGKSAPVLYIEVGYILATGVVLYIVEMIL